MRRRAVDEGVKWTSGVREGPAVGIWESGDDGVRWGWDPLGKLS